MCSCAGCIGSMGQVLMWACRSVCVCVCACVCCVCPPWSALQAAVALLSLEHGQVLMWAWRSACVCVCVCVCTTMSFANWCTLFPSRSLPCVVCNRREHVHPTHDPQGGHGRCEAV